MNMSDRTAQPLRERFISAMSQSASTVNVITTDGAAGRAGITVSAMSSVSADTPRPTLLACVHHMSVAASAIIANGVFCVNVLRNDQAYISDAFAGRSKDELGDKFDCAGWTTLSTGAPRVVDPLVTFDCRVVSSEKVGTHHVFIGEVEDLFIGERGSPLLYSNRTYGAAATLTPDPELPEMAHTRIRKFNTKETYPEQKLDNDLCQAVVARGRTVFLRGQIAQDLETRESVHIGDPGAQAAKAMANIKMLMEEAGGGMEHICRVVVYLTDIRHREAVYREMGKWLKGVYPVSTGLVVSALARPEWLVEIEATAVIPDEDGEK